jgi:putative Mg2+ transporter-C (MgtC) family protein
MSLELQLDASLRLLVAAFLSAAVGFNRERFDHPAGLRTHMLVGIGACLFTIMSMLAFPGGDPSRIASQIVVGIGFLGAGSIIQTNRRGVRGITTAAGIWATAAIGMACGTGLYLLATLAAILIWTVLAVVGRLEKMVVPAKPQTDNHQKADDQNDGDEVKKKPTADKATGYRSID